MKVGKYSIKDLFVNRYVQYIIVPEIQRDYVWEEIQVVGLLNSIIEDYNKYLNGNVPSIDSKDQSDIKDFKSFYKKRKYASNIGFIYAYNDASFSGKYFLIDGQQRITTLYLLLAVLANRNEKLREVFKKNYCIENQPKLGYKVRVEANELLNKFIGHIVSENTDVNDQLWMLNSYKNDLTGKCIISNYNVLQKHLNECKIDKELDFFTYIEDLTEFWYFDTNVSEQGEELYIYMNARGEQMQSNENIKADILVNLNSLDEKNVYGKKWENWQDFFWKYRGENSSADKGFNQFLSCIAGLEHYLNEDKSIFYSKEVFEGKNIKKIPDGIRVEDVLKVLDIQIIEKYFESYKFLVETLESYHEIEGYSVWIPIALQEFWEMFNTNNINWYADYGNRNRNIERNNMVFSWSMFYYIKQFLNDKENIFKPDLVRFFRRVYVRYKNFNRSVTTIKKHVDITLLNGVDDIIDNSIGEISDNADEWQDISVLNEEEVFKNQVILNSRLENNENEVEELIWKIEDHPYNINGRDVGNKNITHLLNRKVNQINVEYLRCVHQKFNELFPEPVTKESQVKLIEILLHYGAFYDRVSPHYYVNLKFDNWRRILRDLSKEIVAPNHTPFSSFFNEFLEFNGTVNEFHQSKRVIINFKENQASTVNSRLLWYSKELGGKMWSQGFNIAIKHQQNDEVLNESFTYINTKGDFKGGNPKSLSQLLGKEIYAN